MSNSVMRGTPSRRHIRIDFCQMWHGFDKENNPVTQALRKYYDVELSGDPEYLFCSTFDYEEQDYSDDCIRILIVGEYVHPNFNLYDYALSFDPIIFNDRNLQFPLWVPAVYKQGRDERSMFDHAVREADESLFERDFCSFVYSSPSTAVDRVEWLDRINGYRGVDCGGKLRNNVGGRIKDKAAFLRAHKFDLTIENNITPGHCTEKLIEAFAAHQIPIYLGDPEISRFFNKAAFIDLSDYEDPEEAIEEIRRVDTDKERYLAMLRETILTEEGRRILEPSYFEDFLCHIVDQDLREARRRPVYRSQIRARHDLGAAVAREIRLKASAKWRVCKALKWKKFPAPPFYRYLI